MGLPVDTSTVLLLLAPLFLPKLYGLGAQAVANFTKKPGKGSSASHIRQQAEKAHIRQRFGLTSTPALILAAYSAYFLAFGRPFNYFISLGNVPVTAPVSKIQAALAWRGLADKYAEDLNVLISLDLRALYMHFGHVNLVGCYRLLGSVAPKDVLAYSSIQLARSYILRVLVLSYSNRRWKNTILIASIAAFLYEVYSLAATDMRLPTQPAETQSVSEDTSITLPNAHSPFTALRVSRLLAECRFSVRVYHHIASAFQGACETALARRISFSSGSPRAHPASRHASDTYQSGRIYYDCSK